MAEFEKIAKGLAEIVGQEHLKTDPEVTAKYAIDDASPKAVIFPANTKQVAEVVKKARLENLSVIPWGSGSKMGMGYPPTKLDLVLNTSRMNHMLDVDIANLTITIEAGVKFRDIQARLATEEDRCYLPLEDLVTEANEFICSDRSRSGCFLPIDPPFSEKATIGGIVATNSNGPRRLLYGLPRDLVLGVRFVTPKGEIIGAGGKTVKNVSGYDISKLMIGSFGTLGILCEMTLRLLPLPEQMETLLLSFESFSDGCAFTSAVFETKLLPAAVEMMNGSAFQEMAFKGAQDFLPGPYVVVVAMEAFGEAVRRMHREFLEMAESFGVTSHAAAAEDEHRLFWLALSNLQPSLTSRYPEVVALQLNYPVSAWDDIFEFTDRTLAQSGIEHAIITHAGSGVSTVNLLLSRIEYGPADKIRQAMDALLSHCRKADGNVVVQLAPARLRKNLKVWGETGQDLIVMKWIKDQLDPSGIFSPGRFVDAL